MQTSSPLKNSERVAKYADMFSAMGTEPRLRIMRLLLSAHPEGLVVGDIQGELEIPNSTLSHHLEKLKNEDLVKCGAKARSCGTRPIRKRCRSFWNFFTRSAARAIRRETGTNRPNLQIGETNHEHATNRH